MCNLYSMTSDVEAIRRLFGAAGAPNVPALANIFPKQDAPVVVAEDGERRIETMRWGFPPPARGRRPVTNVRNLKSPFWRHWLKGARCLVPVTAFCEWEDTKPKKTQVWFGLKDQPLFAFAGIWRGTAEGRVYAFLTTAANDIVGTIHPKAMPVIIDREGSEAWIDGDTDAALALARPYPSGKMEIVGRGPRASEQPALPI